MFGIGGGEIVVVALVALILFGNEDLPKNMKKLVEGWNKFRGVSNDLQRSWLNVRDQVTRDLLSDEHPRPPENDPNSTSENKDSSDTPVAVSGTGDMPPPEGLHEGSLGSSGVVIQPAEGAVAQGEPVEFSGSTTQPENVAAQTDAVQTNSLPGSDKST